MKKMIIIEKTPKVTSKKFSIISFLLIFQSFTSIVSYPIPYKYKLEVIPLVFILVFGLKEYCKNYFSSKLIPSGNLAVHYAIICFSLSVISVLLATKNFGQPLVFGLLASRRAIYSLVGIIIFILLKKEILTLNYLEKLFIIYFTTMLLVYYLVNIMLPADIVLSTYNAEFLNEIVTYNESRGIGRYRFGPSIIVFGFIYSLLRIKNRYFLIYLFLAIFYFLFFCRGRTVIFLSLLIFVYYYFFVAGLKIKVKFFICAGIFIPLALLLSEGDLGFLNKLMDFFKEGVAALIGKVGSDHSANARIFQAEIAWSYIQKYNYLGIGRISHQWSLTLEQLFGYFHPSDIGLLGIWFVYGIAGVTAFFYLCIKLWNFAFAINRGDTFVFACWLYSIYILASSLMTGSIFISAFGQFSIMLGILTFSQTTSIKRATIVE